MSSDVIFQSGLAFLITSSIIVLCVVISVLSNLSYAQENQELHGQTLYAITKHTSSKQNPYITVGRGPGAIAVSNRNTIYVANYNDNTVSVIDGKNNSKIDDIKVGAGPGAIAVFYGNTIYVANYNDNTVSVIDGKNNTKIDDIKVGAGPIAIGINEITDRVYVANYDNHTVSVIDRKNNTKIDDIKVGGGPGAIGVLYENTIYVSNYFDDTVSVIDGKNNTKIDDIKVGAGPTAIGIDEITDRVYVANNRNDTVSVIDGKNNTKIDDIKVGAGPTAIGVDELRHTIYVANHDNHTVSVINGTTNTKIDDIKVGGGPEAIGVDELRNTIYVANFNDDTVSVIDGNSKKAVTKVMFNTEPFNAGHIECQQDKSIAPTAQQFYIWSGSECTAKPNQGFEFVSWQQNLPGNSTQLINFSLPNTWDSSLRDSILDFLHMKPDKPEATLNITKFGASFTANFKELPPPIPPQYVATLFTVVATAFVGTWLTPTVIGWRKARRQGSKLDSYHNQIKNLYNDGRLDSNDIEKLNTLRDSITDEYSRGKINKEQYDKLAGELSLSYREIFTKDIGSLNNLNNLSENDKVIQLSEIRSNVEDSHIKGKISDEYYTNLKKDISILFQEIFKKRIDSLNNSPENDKVKLLDEIIDDMSDAYSKEKINELHYTLLKEKLLKYKTNKV